MNLLERIFIIVLCALTLNLAIGCENGYRNKNGGGCQKDTQGKDVEDNLLELNFRLDSDQVDELPPNAVVQILVYKFDERESKDSAVLVTSGSSNYSSPATLPTTESWSVGFSPDEACEQNSDCSFKYYWVVQIDMNGDQMICDGDLIQDETITPHQSYTKQELTAKEHDVFLRIKDDGTCHDMSDGWDPLYSMSVRINSQEDVTLNRKSTPYVILSGVDQSAAEVAPFSFVYLQDLFGILPTLPHEMVVEVMEDPVPWVCEDYDETNPCPIGYFYTVYVDVDGDGRICSGDLVQDFDLTPFEYYTLEDLKAETKEFYLKVKDDEDSSCFDPYDLSETAF